MEDTMSEQKFLDFFTADNLRAKDISESAPWEFNPEPAALDALKKMQKDARRKLMVDPETKWNVYTAVKGWAGNQRISNTNPPVALHGVVVDYDMISSRETVLGYINQMPEEQRPNYIEVSLSDKIRLVWIFERPILVPSAAFCKELLEMFVAEMALATLLPGYDKNSTKSAEVWTNGGIWHAVKTTPLAWDYCFGVVCSVSKKASLFDKGEVPLEEIAEEVNKRFPGCWRGEFKLDATGVRFWDEKADNPGGCQVKPDGMLCFTGTIPFMKWQDIFGRDWIEEKKILNLGRAAEGMYFDGRNYWERPGERWQSIGRADVQLRLKGRGLSVKCRKGETQTDVERVLDHLQQQNRIEGAAPLVNYPPGIVEMDFGRVLNICDLRPVQPIQGTDDPKKDFAWIRNFLNGFFARPELMPLDHLLAWLQRSYRAILEHKLLMGQAVFICGPRNNGKTLLSLRIIAPLMGYRTANPLDYMKGESQFNEEMFSAAYWAINDDDAPANDAQRRRMLAKLKGFVVNPIHKCHPKFEKPVTVPWQGRILVTLNDDPGSVGMLMEVEANTRDKQMFFASQEYKGVFPPQEELQAIIARELPFFAHWLLNIYVPPPEVISDDRMGVKSYFDPHILELSHQQTYGSNLLEFLRHWIDVAWSDDKKEWTGAPVALLAQLQLDDHTKGVAHEWTQQKIAKSLTALAKQEGSGVTFAKGSSREFVITRKNG
jgi:hypothetical protein